MAIIPVTKEKLIFNLFQIARHHFNVETFIITKEGSEADRITVVVSLPQNFVMNKPVSDLWSSLLGVLSYPPNHHCLELDKKDIDLIPEAGFLFFVSLLYFLL